MAKKRRDYADDDGRVIANMNVDGMPWYLDAAKKKQGHSENELDLNREETKYVVWGALKAGLLIAGAFILGGLIFILLCIFIWFK